MVSELWINWNPNFELFCGILLTVIGAIFMAIGSTFMKLGLNLESQKQKRVVTYPCYEPKWWFGFNCYILGSVLHVIALGFAPASVLAPMNSIGLIANAFSASAILRESLGKIDIISTCGTVIGVFLCALASSFKSDGNFIEHDLLPEDDPESCMISWRKPWYIIYLIIGGISGIIAFFFVELKETEVLEDQEDILISQSYLNFENNNSDTLQVPLTQISQNYPQTPIFPKQIGLAYGYLAGLIGSQCVLELKELVYCWEYEFSQNHYIWHDPLSYILLIYLALSVWLQIHYLNLGLSRGESTYVVPTYYVVWTFFGTFGGFVKFDEYAGYGLKACIIFGIGFSITVSCITILAIQEMIFLKRYVDEKVPEIPDDQMDLEAQDAVHHQMSNKITFGMGLFQVSMLGRTVGRRPYKNFYQLIRRIRSTASDTALEELDMDFSVDNGKNFFAQTLPHNLRFSNQNKAPKRTKENSKVYIPLEDVN